MKASRMSGARDLQVHAHSPTLPTVETPPVSCSTRPASTPRRCRRSPQKSATPRRRFLPRPVMTVAPSTSDTSRRPSKCRSAGTRRSRPASSSANDSAKAVSCCTRNPAMCRSTSTAMEGGMRATLTTVEPDLKDLDAADLEALARRTALGRRRSRPDIPAEGRVRRHLAPGAGGARRAPAWPISTTTSTHSAPS